MGRHGGVATLLLAVLVAAHAASEAGIISTPTMTTTTKTAAGSSPTDSPSTAGAEYSNQSSRGFFTVWGHDDTARGADHVTDETLLSRLDVLQELRRHSPLEKCRAALDALLRARERLKLWALRMHSSSARLPDALLSGDIYHLGDYDGCVSVPAAAYCLLDVEVRPAVAAAAAADAARLHIGDERSPFEPPHGHNGTLWDLLQTSGNRRRFRRDLQHWGLCVPSACVVVDADAGEGDPRPPRPPHRRRRSLDVHQLGVAVADALRGLARTLAVELRVHLADEYCAVSEDGGDDDDDDATFWGSLLDQPLFLAGSLFILSFPALAVVATLWSVVRKAAEDRAEAHADGGAATSSTPRKQGVLSRMLDCFAVQGHWHHLRRKQESQIHAIQGLRTISMILVIFGHGMVCFVSGPLSNPEYIESSYTDVPSMYVINMPMVVSTFFVISGFLDIRLCLRHMQSDVAGFHVVLLHYLHRFLRLVPALAVVLAVEAVWVEHLGSGPAWYQQAGRFADSCKVAWWTHLFFINNLVNVGGVCMVQTWFLAADMQLHLATPLIAWLVLLLTRRRGAGGDGGRRRGGAVWPALVLLGALLAVAAVVRYANTVLRGLNVIVYNLPELYRDWVPLAADPTFSKQYIALHTNAIPYVVGLIAGTLLHFTKERGWQLSKWSQTALWVGVPVGHALQTAVLLSGALVYLPGLDEAVPPTLLALYGPARQLLFAMPTALTIFTCAMGFGGVIDSFLTWTPFLSLGRLTYSVFLVHMTVINVRAGLLRHPNHLTSLGILSTLSADVVISIAFGLALHLAVEAPLAKLQAMLIKRSFDARKAVPDEQLQGVGREETTPVSALPPRRERSADIRQVESFDTSTSKGWSC